MILAPFWPILAPAQEQRGSAGLRNPVEEQGQECSWWLNTSKKAATAKDPEKCAASDLRGMAVYPHANCPRRCRHAQCMTHVRSWDLIQLDLARPQSFTNA